MKPSKFKVGDKVRIVKFPDITVIGQIARVTYSYNCSSTFICDVQLLSNSDWECPMKANEIECAIKVGEQLLFDFMNKEQL